VTYPLQLELDAPLVVARWRPLVHWLLIIPQAIVVYALAIVQNIIWILSFFAILFTGRMPESFFGFMAMTHRYQWRVGSYYLFMREAYPPFEFQTVGQDPGDDPARLNIQAAPKLSRGLIFVKWLLAIPHFIVLFFLGIAVYVVAIIAFFAVLITGQWPESLRAFVIGVMRWSYRVSIYVYLMTDQYPPFSLD
jgi:small-conductance mechanosensitive channel